MRAGDIISEANVRSMLSAGGLSPVHLQDLVGKRVSEDLEIGTAVTWDVVSPHD
jgi:sialic acid synthase SpsE